MTIKLILFGNSNGTFQVENMSSMQKIILKLFMAIEMENFYHQSSSVNEEH